MDPNSLALLMGSAGGAAGPATYVEDVFQTWLYTGTGATQTITNGIDLAGKGGLVWIKNRTNGDSNILTDTARGVGKVLYSDLTNAQGTATWGVDSFGSSGFNVTGTDRGNNATLNNYASWTFRKQAKFFDVVTWTGDGTDNRLISHNLGSRPGAIIAKKTSGTSHWPVWHQSLTGGGTYNTNRNAYLNLNFAAGTEQCFSSNGNVDVTSTTFPVSALIGSESLNQNGATYVAYLFAHDAGGFGASGNDSVIKCGSFTGAGYLATTTIDLGWEPQWILAKRTDAVQGWVMFDNMRGMDYTSSARLQPNTSGAEASMDSTGYFRPTPTGFIYGPDNYMGDTAQVIYIAIRRGPMKTPTDATKVFATSAYTGNGGTNRVISGVGFPGDLMFGHKRSATGAPAWYDRLRGKAQYLQSNSTGAEGNTGPVDEGLLGQDSFTVDDSYGQFNNNTATYIMWLMRRAPGFFDVVAYTGTGVARTLNHNLNVVPELMIVKPRSAVGAWVVGANFGSSAFDLYTLNSDVAASTAVSYSTAQRFSAQPSSTVFSIGASASTNASGTTYVAYLFGSVSGVSKVGSYTGTGTTLSIDCGFTAGARFVLIKRADSTGDWYVWDTARGIIANNDPYLLLNSTAAEVTNTDYIDPLNSGFQISSTAPAAINANGGSFIYLAIA